MQHPYLNIATAAARKAGQIIVRSLERLDTIKVSKKDQNDYVSEIDRKAEAEILYHINKAYPNHGIIAEESGKQMHDGYDDTVWIIDPLDGTTNFLHGFPHFAISIAVEYKGQLEHGLIYDPIRDEIFTATNGNGARLNDRRIRVSQCGQLSNALIGTGFPYRNFNRFPEYITAFAKLIPQVLGVRRAGAAALDLAYVACGRLDGFWEMGLSPWDMAAGAVLIREAGGYVGDFHGKEGFMSGGDIIAGAPKIYEALLAHIEPTLQKAESK